MKYFYNPETTGILPTDRLAEVYNVSIPSDADKLELKNKDGGTDYWYTINHNPILPYDFDGLTQKVSGGAHAELIDGRYVLFFDVESITLDEAKERKLQEISDKSAPFNQFKCPVDMYIISSLGFKLDADVRSQTNMEGLISVMQEGQTTMYKDFDNKFHEMTREDLQLADSECKQNGLNLYQQKFELEAQVAKATTVNKVNKIAVEFVMTDFSK